MRWTIFIMLAVLVTLGTFAAQLCAADVTAERSPHGATVKIDGKLFTEYLTQSGTKPVLWPVIGPTGKSVTRAWPVEGEPEQTKDHPHHRSLWFTHGSVNGIDFWTDVPADKRGRVVHRDFVKIASGAMAEIVARDDWLSPEGKKVCEDECRLLFGAEDTSRWIDYAITLRASEGPVEFGDTKEGTFGLRVADSMRVDAKRGGRIVNSRGQTDAAAWAQPAEWVDYHGPLDGGAPRSGSLWASPSSITPAASAIRPAGTCGPTDCSPPIRLPSTNSAATRATRSPTRCRKARSLSCAIAFFCTSATRSKAAWRRPSRIMPSKLFL